MSQEKSLLDKVNDVHAVVGVLSEPDKSFVEVIASAENSAALAGQVTKVSEGEIVRLEALHSQHVQG